MDYIDIQHIDENRLDACYYFQSLLEEAADKNILFQKDIHIIYNQLLVILEQQAGILTEEKSSSIPMEKAQIVLESICYVISYQLKTMSIEKAISCLKNYSINDLYQQGLALIYLKIEELKNRHHQLVKHLINSENVFYRSTVVDGIQSFFQMYDPRFEAQEIHITLDYPTCLKRPYLLGVELIDKYMSYIEVENELCSLFDEKDIHDLLCGLIDNYQNVFLNIYEFILLSLTGLILLNKSYQHLNLEKKDIHKLYLIFHQRTNKDLFILLKKSFLRFYRKEKLSIQLLNYTTLCLYKLSKEVEEAVKMKTLDKMFLVPHVKDNEPVFFYSYGQRMDDQSYQHLIRELYDINDVQKRVSLILEKITSLADFLDLLHDISFHETELKIIVDQLSLADLAAIMKQLYQNDYFIANNKRHLDQILIQKKHSLTDQELKEFNMIMKYMKK